MEISIFSYGLSSVINEIFLHFSGHGMFGSTDFSQQAVWPLILAVSLGILFALFFTIVTVIIMWKTKCYKKLSFFSGKLEEEKQMASRQLSTIPESNQESDYAEEI